MIIVLILTIIISIKLCNKIGIGISMCICIIPIQKQRKSQCFLNPNVEEPLFPRSQAATPAPLSPSLLVQGTFTGKFMGKT
jgi:hypothetical protein